MLVDWLMGLHLPYAVGLEEAWIAATGLLDRFATQI
jgi:hypothetical protein